MPFAIPIAMAASTAISAGMAQRQASAARKQSAPLIAQQTALAQQQAAIAKLAGPALSETSDFYGRLLHGDKATLNATLSPEIASITELSRGAERALDRGPAGPQRDVARAELARQKVGQIGGLFPQARQAAATGLTNLGSIAMGGASGAGNLYESLMQGQRADRAYTDSQHEALGSAIGPLLVDFYKAWQNQPKYGTPGSKSYVPGIPAWSD